MEIQGYFPAAPLCRHWPRGDRNFGDRNFGDSLLISFRAHGPQRALSVSIADVAELVISLHKSALAKPE